MVMFANLKNLMQAYLESGKELGASLCVNIAGENVVDIWGGYKDEAKTTQWNEDTICNMWSTTKTISSLAAFILVDRGLLDLNEKVCKYWPEFAANGKQDIEVRHVMSHASGLAAWEKPITLEEIYDTEKSTTRLGQQAPWWTPGTASGYHSLTHGPLIGELVRRTTGKSLKQFIAEDIAAPLGADFQLGAQEKDYPRVATIIPHATPAGPPPSPPAGSVMEKALNVPPIDATVSATKAWRDAELGGANGHGNGRSVARILSAISLGGTVDGVQLLSPETIDKIFVQQAYGEDLVVGLKLRVGTGFGLPAKGTYWDWAPGDTRVCGWGGWGGSMGIMDLDRKMSIGYVMNKMHPVGLGSECTKAYVVEIYKVMRVEI